jgi:uncharacterized protein (DUF433 family)
MSELTSLTTAEAAFVADIPDRDVRRVFEEDILKEPLVRRAGTPRVSYLGAACAMFYFKTESIYAAAFRRLVLDSVTSRLPAMNLMVIEDICNLRTKPPGGWLLDLSGPMGDLVHIEFGKYVIAVQARRSTIEKSLDLITSDPEIYGGVPVFKGTRIPIDAIATSLRKGTDRHKLLSVYPDLTPEQLDAAKVYAEVHPPRGRPRKSMPGTWKARKTTRVPGRSTGA